MKECLNLNLTLNGKQCNITLIYTSPSQSSEGFQTFLTNFELLLDNVANRNPFISIIIGNFNATSKIAVIVIKQLMKVKSLNP